MLKKEGFKFSFDSSKCEECGGKCCSGESGYIFVTPSEIVKIAEFLNIDFEKFCYKYVKKIGYRYSLLETIENGNNYSCIFLKNGKCSIYEVRPNQCVSFPFWDGFKDDFTDLLKECIGVCEK